MEEHFARQALSAPEQLQSQARQADKIMLAAVLLGAVAALCLGQVYGGAATAAMLVLALASIALLVCLLAAGSLTSRMVLAACGMLMVALQMQLSRGVPQVHLGVFVWLAALLVYKDWRPVVAAGALAVLHHVIVDRLQWAGLPVFLLAHADFGRAALHCLYIALLTGLLATLALHMQAQAQESAELRALCETDGLGSLRLNPGELQVFTPVGVAVRNAFLQLDTLVQQVHGAAQQVLHASQAMQAEHAQMKYDSDIRGTGLHAFSRQMLDCREQALRNASALHGLQQSAQSASSASQHCLVQAQEAMHTMQAWHSRVQDHPRTSSMMDDLAHKALGLAQDCRQHGGPSAAPLSALASTAQDIAQLSALAAQQLRQLRKEALQHMQRSTDLLLQAGSGMQASHVQQLEMLVRVAQSGQAASRQARLLQVHGLRIERLSQDNQQHGQLAGQSVQTSHELLQQALGLRDAVTGFLARDSMQAAGTPTHTPEAATPCHTAQPLGTRMAAAFVA